MIYRAEMLLEVATMMLMSTWYTIRKMEDLAVFVSLLTGPFWLVGSASIWFVSKGGKQLSASELNRNDIYSPPTPDNHLTGTTGRESARPDPVQWLRQNTYTSLDQLSSKDIITLQETRPKAALISLVRNSELDAIVESIAQVEDRFNNRDTHHYDWVFFNNVEFTDEFKAIVSNATRSQCFFEVIPHEHWRIPDWIDRSRFDVGRQYMGGIGVGKAWLESYHHMCRWNSGLFALEKRLRLYDYYWRVEPGVEYFCDINYDVFRFMRDNNLSYGFNMAILEDERAIPSLWERTKDFIRVHKDILDEKADLSWLLQMHKDDEYVDMVNSNDKQGFLGVDSILDSEYNNCQFYSNFEVGSLEFFRGEKNMAYFDYLDKQGGFFYERLGDAPIHTLSVSMFLPKSQIWFFRDIGYSHGICQQCPPHESDIHTTEKNTGRSIKPLFGVAAEEVLRLRMNKEVHATIGSATTDVATLTTTTKELVLSKDLAITSNEITMTFWDKLARDYASGYRYIKEHDHWELIELDLQRQNQIPGLACGCTVNFFDVNFAKLVPYESRQRKPSDTCIRMWLGGRWLKKKPGWTRQADIAAGGDGYGGYVLDGLLSNPFATKIS
ncbi:putative mannosyltransferase ktr4 [Diatrype stigma]|uniref:Mannosyltransferase ktr4 n=1 Tax=Diatrype stigma TaxID=117547 RepID=A0AAN9UUX4_9PEZI